MAVRFGRYAWFGSGAATTVNLALANPSMLISRLLFCLRMASSSAKIFRKGTDAILS